MFWKTRRSTLAQPAPGEAGKGASPTTQGEPEPISTRPLSNRDRAEGLVAIDFPLSLSDPAGPFGRGIARILSNTTDRGVAYVRALPRGVDWLEEFEEVYFEALPGGDGIKAIREATDEDRKQYRSPDWIQEPDVPECCGRRMYFVGQIDDDRLCAERPPGAKTWWHDSAAFYVFTCTQCLGVKAVGQQY